MLADANGSVECAVLTFFDDLEEALPDALPDEIPQREGLARTAPPSLDAACKSFSGSSFAQFSRNGSEMELVMGRSSRTESFSGQSLRSRWWRVRVRNDVDIMGMHGIGKH